MLKNSDALNRTDTLLRIFGASHRENIYEFIKLAAENNFTWLDKNFVAKNIFAINSIKTRKNRKFTDCIVRAYEKIKLNNN